MAQGIARAQDVIITWVDNSTDENGFVIERTLSLNCAGGWQVVGYTGVNQTSFTDIRIPAACYRVAAYNERGLSAYSNIAQVPQAPNSYTPTTVQDYLGTSTDYTVQANGANTTENVNPQSLSSIEISRDPELQRAAAKALRPELPDAVVTSDRAHVPAKLDPIARPLIIRPPQGGKPIKTWSVQVSATASEEIANRLAQQLKSEGYVVYVVQAEVKGHTYHRVRIGPFNAREQAESMRQSLARRDMYRDAYVIIDPAIQF